MSKLIIRLTILAVAVYMVLCHILAFAIGINIWSHTYTVLFEICVCICISAQGKYHCKFMRWTAYGICISDTLVSLDEMIDFLPYSVAVFAPVLIIAAGLTTTVFLSIRHFARVKRLKRIWKVNPPENSRSSSRG